MAFDLEEQEQIAALKSWWSEYGTLVAVAALVAALTAAGIQGWRYYRHSQALAAVTLYGQLEQAERAGDRKKVRDIAGAITRDYTSTAYASLAAMSAAHAAFEGGDLAGARSELQWVVDRATQPELRDLARLRLAGVLLDENKPGDALKLVETSAVESLAARFADLRGDILLAQGKPAEARGAYQVALDRSDSGSSYRNVIQVKLDALGDAR